MVGYDHLMWGGWFISIILWAAILVAVIWGVKTIFSHNNDKRNDRPSSDGPSAMEILKRRYASGEISKEEFDRMRRDLME